MDNSMTELGSRADGVLREYGIFSEEGLVAIPDSLSYAEAATLPCAALTAWNCLFGARRLLPGDTVVTQGTGGVSIFAAQFALAAGAQVISTTSSAAKGKRLKELGVHHVINYVEDPNWGETAKKLSLDGRGADCIIEIGGPSTMGQSFKAAALDGEIAVVGSRGGKGEGDTSLANARSLTCRIRRILVGSRLQFEQMNRAVEVNGIKPVIDGKLFKFEEAESALRYLSEGRAFGKVVVEI
jgi:NADPH:quinone reductase-like Zn-dependent oxidoreductase